MGKKVLLIGCGQLGSRHLQAISSLQEIEEIFVLDSNSDSLKLGRTRVGEIENKNPRIKFYWLTDFDEHCSDGDLCIIATSAKNRPQLIKKAAEIGYKKIFIEKIVCQSMDEYENLMAFSKKEGLFIWINCQTRAYEIHKYIKSILDPKEPIIFGNYGGNHGLACNGIHYADLFLFYDGNSEIKSAGSRIDNKLHVSRRGPDIYDLSGTLQGYSARGSDFILSYSGLHESPDYVSVVSSKAKFIIDHICEVAFESRPENDWAWKQIPLKENIRISHMSKKFVSDMLNSGVCDLPQLEECYYSHKYILEALLPTFNRLLNINDDRCPVT